MSQELKIKLEPGLESPIVFWDESLPVTPQFKRQRTNGPRPYFVTASPIVEIDLTNDNEESFAEEEQRFHAATQPLPSATQIVEDSAQSSSSSDEEEEASASQSSESDDETVSLCSEAESTCSSQFLQTRPSLLSSGTWHDQSVYETLKEAATYLHEQMQDINEIMAAILGTSYFKDDGRKNWLMLQFGKLMFLGTEQDYAHVSYAFYELKEMCLWFDRHDWHRQPPGGKVYGVNIDAKMAMIANMIMTGN